MLNTKKNRKIYAVVRIEPATYHVASGVNASSKLGGRSAKMSTHLEMVCGMVCSPPHRAEVWEGQFFSFVISKRHILVNS